MKRLWSHLKIFVRSEVDTEGLAITMLRGVQNHTV